MWTCVGLVLAISLVVLTDQGVCWCPSLWLQGMAEGLPGCSHKRELVEVIDILSNLRSEKRRSTDG